MTKPTTSELVLGLAVILMAIFLHLEHNKLIKAKSELSLSKALLQSSEKDVKIGEIRKDIETVKNRKIMPTGKKAGEFWNGLYKK